MDAVATPSTIWRQFVDAWRARKQRANDVANPCAEREAALLLRQYASAAVLLSVTVVASIGAAMMRPPSPFVAIGTSIAALAVGYVLVLTELTAVPQTLRSIPSLRSRRLRRLRLATAAVGTANTALPLILVAALLVTPW